MEESEFKEVQFPKVFRKKNLATIIGTETKIYHLMNGNLWRKVYENRVSWGLWCQVNPLQTEKCFWTSKTRRISRLCFAKKTVEKILNRHLRWALEKRISSLSSCKNSAIWITTCENRGPITWQLWSNYSKSTRFSSFFHKKFFHNEFLKFSHPVKKFCLRPLQESDAGSVKLEKIYEGDCQGFSKLRALFGISPVWVFQLNKKNQ